MGAEVIGRKKRKATTVTFDFDLYETINREVVTLNKAKGIQTKDMSISEVVNQRLRKSYGLKNGK